MAATAFALLADSPAAPVSNTPPFTYDYFRQINVDAAGVAVVETADANPAMLFGPTMTHNHEGLKKDDD